MKKLLVVGIIILLVGMSIPSTGKIMEQPSTVSSHGVILYVGGSGEGNYTKIQDAKDDVSNGDTIFVFNDSSPYQENVKVNKTINLIGEDKNTTIIEAKKDYVIKILASNVLISGFTITSILGHSISSGISIHSNKNIIEDNILKDIDGEGIIIHDNNKNIISRNTIRNCFFGSIRLRGQYNIITENTLISPPYTLIWLLGSINNKIVRNHIEGYNGNLYNGILIWFSNRNKIYQNNFIDSTVDSTNSFLNRWNENYYSDWKGTGPKILTGLIWIYFGTGPGVDFELEIPYPIFDWHPASEPYDIGG